MWITVTNSLGEIRATAHGTTGDIPWWGGDTGLSTNYNVVWDGVQPDIQAGDYVYLMLGNGRSAELHLGTISGTLDLDTDTLYGQIIADWLPFPVDGDCGVWIDNGPGMGFMTDDQGYFTCDFSPYIDILPGMDVGVGYNDPKLNKVYNVFHGQPPICASTSGVRDNLPLETIMYWKCTTIMMVGQLRRE